MHGKYFKTLMWEMTTWIRSPKAHTTKSKQNKWDYIKLMRLCTTMEILSRMKSDPTQREKKIANHLRDKESTSRIYKQLKKLNNRKRTNLIRIRQRTWTVLNMKNTRSSNYMKITFITSSHQGHTYQNHNESSRHLCQNG